MLVLETARLRLTTWQPEHLDDLVLLHSDPDVMRYLNADGKPESRQQAKQRLALWADNFAARRLGKLRLARKLDGVFLGRAGFGLYAPTGEPELGYALRRDFWGNGYALEAASGLRDWFFRETGGDHFIGLADTRNVASLRILEAIGMVPMQLQPDNDGLMAQFFSFRREAWRG